MEQTIDQKLQVLVRIAQQFQTHELTWAVGASTMLYLKGAVDTFHDIDLMIPEADVDTVQTLLDEMGTRKPSPPVAQYQSKAFLEYEVAGVDIDVIAGFVIVHDGTPHTFPFRGEDVDARVCLQGTDIPLQSATVWREYYRLMGRAEKAAIIDDFLAKV